MGIYAYYHSMGWKNKPAACHAGYASIRPLAFFADDDAIFRSEQAAPLAPVIPRTRVGLKPGCTVWHEAGLYFYPYCDCRRIYPYWWLLPLFLIFMEVNKFKKNKVVWFRDSHVYMLFYITCRCSYVGLDSILLLFVVGKNDALRAEYTILIFFLY